MKFAKKRVNNNGNNRRIEIRQCKYLNNIIEQVVQHPDHRFIKRKTKLVLGLKNFDAAQTLVGVERVCMLKKGQQRYSSQCYKPWPSNFTL